MTDKQEREPWEAAYMDSRTHKIQAGEKQHIGWFIGSKKHARRIVACVNTYQARHWRWKGWRQCIPTELLESLECGLIPANETAASYKVRADEAEALLRQCAEYFDQRADAEYFPDSPRPHANEEMGFLTEIRAFLAKMDERAG